MPAKKYFTEEERIQANKESDRKYREKHLFKIKEAQKIWYQNNKNKVIEKVRSSYKYNDSVKKRLKKYYENNKQECLERSKNWKLQNKDKVKKHNENWKKCNSIKVKEMKKKHYENNKSDLIMKAKEYYENNKEHSLEVKKLWKRNNKDKVSAMKIKYFALHKKEIMARDRQWKLKNKAKVKATIKRWVKNNYDRILIHKWKRRDLKLVLGEVDRLSIHFKKKVYAKYKNRCYNCNSENNLSIDHHYPLSLGNPLTLNNAVLLCKSCNSSKSNKLPESFYSPEQLTDLQLNYGISKSPLKEEQPSLFEARMPKNLERDNGILEAMNAA